MSSYDEDSLAISPREDSPESHPFSGQSDYGDSGVVVNGGLHNNASISLVRNHLARSVPRRPAAYPSPLVALTEIRRPSLPFVDMSANGAGLAHVPAEELEMMYAFHGNAGRRNSQPSTEAGEESSGIAIAQQSSLSASQERLTRPPKTVKCFSPNWWNPKFSSPILERHLKKKVIEFLRRRFRIAVLFIALSSLLWIVFFSVHLAFRPPQTAEESEERVNDLAADSVRFTWWYVVGGAVLFISVLVMLALTYSDYYGRLALLLTTTLTIILMCCSVALSFALHFDSNVQGFSTMWLVAQFSITGVVTLVIFTLSQLPILFSAILCIVYLIISNSLSILFTIVLNSKTYPRDIFGPSAFGTLLFYCALILIGCSTAFISQKRQHATFWKIAQCVLSQKAMDLERELEEKMILSILPQPFAERMMSVDVQLSYMMKQSVGGTDNKDTGFTISQLDRVTILFADIVEFTEFSSNLSAEELVGILNEIFSTFDDLVSRYKCEKISTLGDCYFCVSGCPEPISSHANNCVDLGLAIMEALEEFRRQTGHPLEMRVGIHTGSVLCGVMGTKRFKFDVWSKDVTVANQIEACGTPGRVLISAATKHFLSSAYVVEEARLHNQDPDLVGLQLFYVVGRRHRALSLGTSVKEWRRRLSAIDTVAQPLPATELEQRRGKAFDPSLCCFWRKKHTLADPQLPPSGSQSSSSIAEIFSMQTQLQKCTSYAELTDPETQQQTNMDHKIVELMEEQKVDFDTYFDPQLRVLTLQFRDHDWENAYRNYGRNLDDGSSGDMMETEIGYRITKQSYMYDTVTLFLVFLMVMLGSLAVLCGRGTFSLWTSWLPIFMVGLCSESFIILLVWAVYQPQRFPARFAAYAQFVINWYVRSFVSLFMIYYPMTIVYASIGQCTGDIIENTQDLATIQMAFFVTIVVLISSITFMEVSHFVKLIGGLLSAILAIVMIMTLHLQICLRDININSTISSDEMPLTVATPISYRTDSPQQYLTNYYHRHVAPEAVILLLLILLILAVVNRMSEVSVRLSFIGRIEAAGRRRYTRQQKTQAEWLLFNIIPPRVAYQLRRTGRYSQNHDCVGVVFMSIANFNEFHRLTSEIQGEAPYCILNQIITEFDTLLERQFANVEKIKTIGSVYMAASGLDTEGPDIVHLLELVEFAQQMFQVLEALNRQFQTEDFCELHMEDFAFELKVGFNYGPVTSGVVGSRKMLYDIWGDTVNVASRMNSMGKVGKIHMPEVCLEKLGEDVDIRFERHAEVNIKGKGAMRTVFVTHAPHAT